MNILKNSIILSLTICIGLVSTNLKAQYEEIPLENLACRSNSYGFNMSPNGTYLAILTSPKENKCDIHDVKSEYAVSYTHLTLPTT